MSLLLVTLLQGDTPRQSLDRWLRAMNSGDLALMKAFHTENHDLAHADWDVARRAGKLTLVRDVTGGFLVKLEKTNEYNVFITDPEPGIRPARRDEIFDEVPRATASTLVRRVQDHLNLLVRNDRFSGSITLMKGDKTLVERTAGYAHLGYGVKNRPDTKFNLASMGKMFTAAMVAKRVESGRWKLDSKVGEIWPEVPNPAIRDKVTLRHLLSHRSGMADLFTDEFMMGSKDRWKTVAQTLPLFIAKPLQFEPGSTTAYSNAGFVLLGKLLEVDSRKDYWKLAEEEIFKPFGMRDTGAYEVDQDTPNLAFGYTNTDGEGVPFLDGPRNNLFMHVAKGSPAGGAYSTIPDILKFSKALREGKIIRSDTLKTMTEPTGSLGGPGSYGLGFQLWSVPGEQVYGHTGGFPGIAGMMLVYPKSGYTVIAFSNRDFEALSATSRVRMLIADTLGL